MTTRKPIVLINGVLQELNTPTDGISFAGNTTTDLPEGTNLYYTDTRARGALSVSVGSGLTYNSGTGTFGTSAIPNGQLANSSITIGSTSISLGSTATTLAGLLSVTSDAVQIGTAAGANSILLNGSGITFEGSTADSYETTLTSVDPTADRTVSLPNETDVLASQTYSTAISIALG